MKKFIAITISLCLLFCSFVPVYAEAWTSTQATTVVNQLSFAVSHLNDIEDLLRLFLEVPQGSSTLVWSWTDIATELVRVYTWLVPSGTITSSNLSLWDYVWFIANQVNSTWSNWSSSFSSINSYVSGILTLNNYLNSLRLALTNVKNRSDSGNNDWSVRDYRTYANVDMFNGNLGNTSTVGSFPLYRILTDNTSVGGTEYWGNGTPLGNIAAILWLFNNSFVNNSMWNKDAMLKHYADTLSTWDSQGSTLTQVNFTPESAIQGLYRYLAFTQRDVARLTHVLASDEEIEVREKAQANQDAVLDNFIDSNGSGTVSDTSFSDVAGASDSFKDNFNTGVSGSSIWNVFDNSRYNWFTQNTKNQLDTTPQTRNATDYPTPLLDTYYNEMFNILGGSSLND